MLVFLQRFKNFVINNDTPDVGSYIETFSKDFEALFKLHPLVIEKSHLAGYLNKPEAEPEEQKQEDEEKEHDYYESKDSDIQEIHSDEENPKYK